MNNKTVITMKIKPLPVALGHRQHVTGTGVHGDKRTKRNRTRSQQRQSWQKEMK